MVLIFEEIKRNKVEDFKKSESLKIKFSSNFP
jgi:hypothetical protein